MTSSTEPADLFRTETLGLTTSGAVAELTLLRPEIDNRMDAALHRDLVEALEVLGRASEVRAAVFASSGRRFAAGADFGFTRAMHDDPVYRREIIEEGKRIVHGFLDLPMPVVAAVHGDAIGLSCTLALTCDAVVTTSGVRLGDPHVLIGLAAGDGGCVVWPVVAGMVRAKRHLLTGDPVTAEDAVALGIVTDMVDTSDEVLPAARALACRIAALPPLAVQGTKAVLNGELKRRADDILRQSFAREEITLGSADLLEGLSAFEERRPGRYLGR